MKQFMHNIKIKMVPISPLHIGDGDVYEPTNYVMDDGKLYCFDEATFMAALSTKQREELLKIVTQPNSYQALQLFYRREDIKKIAKENLLYSVDVADSIYQDYQKSLGRVKQKETRGKEVFNTLMINSTLKSNYQAFIPGSSVKGALKTAFFSYEAEGKPFGEVAEEVMKFDKRLQKRVLKDYKFKSDYFGKFETDPFSKLKVSDFITDDPKLKVKWAVNKKRKEKDYASDNTEARFEFIGEGAAFVGEINLMDLIDENLLHKINQKRDRRHQLHQPAKVYMQEDIREIANNFYLPKWEKEFSWAQERKGVVSDSYLQNGAKYIEKAKSKKGFLLRVGRHSGAESMSIDNHRKIYIPQMKNKQPHEMFVDAPFTYWLASEVKEVKGTTFIGWVYCEFIDDGAYQIQMQKSLDKMQTNLKEIAQRKNVLRQKAKERQAYEEAKRLEREQKRREEALKQEQERKEKEAKLAAMSPLERKIEELLEANPNKSETADVVIFNAIKNGKLDEYKCEALQLVKEEMQKLKNWIENPKKQNKKYKRTMEVKKMLEECEN